MKVFVNAGHDRALDSGALGKYDDHEVRECDIAADVAAKVCQMLEENGIETMLVQSDNLCGEEGYDYYQSVVGLCNEFDPDVAVSIHTNAYNGTAQGTETLIYNTGGDTEEFAQWIQDNIVNNLDMVDRGLKVRENLAFLRATHCKACLVEMGFIDNEEDVIKLVEQQDDFAYAIAKGIMQYLDV